MADELEVKFTENVDDGKSIRLLCAHCRSRNNHLIIASSHEHATVDGMWFDTTYYIARCKGCDQQKFATNATSSEDIDYSYNPKDDSYEAYLAETVKVYPFVNINYEEPRSFFSIPLELRRVHQETYTALCAGTKKLAAIGMRAIIETICAVNNVTDDIAYTLPAKIRVLRKKQIISPSMKDVLLSIKEFGDKGVHALGEPTDEELKVAWDAINVLVSSIYGTEDTKNTTASLKGFKRTKRRQNSEPVGLN